MIVQCDLNLLDLKVELRRAKTKSEDLCMPVTTQNEIRKFRLSSAFETMKIEVSQKDNPGGVDLK